MRGYIRVNSSTPSPGPDLTLSLQTVTVLMMMVTTMMMMMTMAVHLQSDEELHARDARGLGPAGSRSWPTTGTEDIN